MTGYAFHTHDVTNQSPPFEDIDLFCSDAALGEAVARDGAGWALPGLAAFGRDMGSAERLEMGRRASANPPQLRAYDPTGFRIDRVDYDPAYHQAMSLSFAAGIHSLTWETAPPGQETGRQVARLAHLYLMTQVEPGHVCPITMTHAATPTLRNLPALHQALAPKLTSRDYDPSFSPWQAKRSVTVGMGMTEKQGGTDVRANTTTAAPLAGSGPGSFYRLIGHKWFMSAPMSDAFLMLAHAPGGLSCFFVPRFTVDGALNALRLRRLKSKLGNHANASSEVELEGAEAILVGEEGRGVLAIIEMVTQTRLDCAIASAGQMRLALAIAIHHCRHRRAFGRALVDQPVMAVVLADMALDVEAATALAFRLARAFDRAASDPAEGAWLRVMTAATKYWNCKIAPALGYEAMECLGGNGYVEDGLAARLYRELPLNAIWEGSGNVMCLDLRRSLVREGDKVAAVLTELRNLSAGERRLQLAIENLETQLGEAAADERTARAATERLARTAAAALLHAHAPPVVADAFLAARIDAPFASTYGSGPPQPASEAIIDRAFPPA
jgi:putative acyl-CoA dehydrogenase